MMVLKGFFFFPRSKLYRPYLIRGFCSCRDLTAHHDQSGRSVGTNERTGGVSSPKALMSWNGGSDREREFCRLKRKPQIGRRSTLIKWQSIGWNVTLEPRRSSGATLRVRNNSSQLLLSLFFFVRLFFYFYRSLIRECSLDGRCLLKSVLVHNGTLRGSVSWASSARWMETPPLSSLSLSLTVFLENCSIRCCGKAVPDASCSLESVVSADIVFILQQQLGVVREP